MKNAGRESASTLDPGPAITDEGTIAMGHTPDIRNSDSAQDLQNTWHAYQAFRLAEKRNPELLVNPIWVVLRDEAYEHFVSAMWSV